MKKTIFVYNVLFPGLQIQEAYAQADVIDRVLDKELSYAFDEQFGYLTSCPTNTGTGLTCICHDAFTSINNDQSK